MIGESSNSRSNIKTIECSNIIIEKPVILENIEEKIVEVELGVDTESTLIQLDANLEENISSESKMETTANAAPVEINFLPTAPPIINESVITPLKYDNVSYPQLQEMEQQESATNMKHIREKLNEITLNLKPFTDKELEEHYCNKQINRCKCFEEEFIQYELQADHYATNGYLYNLLLLYAKHRALVRSCKFEIDDVQKSSLALQSEIWFRENSSKKGQGTCSICGTTKSVTQKFEIISVNNIKKEELKCQCKNLVDLAFNQYKYHNYTAEITQLQVIF